MKVRLCRLVVLFRLSAISLIIHSWLNIGAILFPSLFGIVADDQLYAHIPRLDQWTSVGTDLSRSHVPKGGACDGYAGVLHIQSGDKGAAAGTLFFQYIINQLIYAEMYNLIPWIHLNNVSASAYDAEEHGGPSASFRVKRGDVEMISKPWVRAFTYPGPINHTSVQNFSTLTISGNGVWDSYFEPVSPFRIDDPLCKSKVFITLDGNKLTPGIQFNAPWAVRSWPYRYSPRYLQDRGVELHDWYRPMRERAAAIVDKYYRPKRWLEEAVEAANPIGDSPCLAMHVRWSDKGGIARRRIDLDDYLPYAQAFVDAGGGIVYLATDSTVVQRTIEEDWPLNISKKVRYQKGVVQSKGKRPVFNLAAHHRTNMEILTEIYSMARCRLFLHGFSAVSEATMYLNPALHNSSVDLEDPHHMSANEFSDMAKAIISNG